MEFGPAFRFGPPFPTTFSGLPFVNDFHLNVTFASAWFEQRTIFSDRSRGLRKAVKVKRWRRIKEIGRGGFGIVYLEQDQDGKSRAVKEVLKSMNKRDIDPLRELTAMAALSKDEANFVHLEGWFENDTHLFIAMEYFELGDLVQCLEQPVTESEARTITFQLNEAIEFMHKNNFTHRDLKPANVFVVQQTPSWWVKLADLGIAKRVEEDVTVLHTSFDGDFMAPEICGFATDDLATQYTSAVDMWGLGSIAHWLLTLNVLVPRRDYLKFCFRRVPASYEEVQRRGASQEAIDFISSLVKAAPEERLTATQALDHPWIKERPQALPAPGPFIEEVIDEAYLNEPGSVLSLPDSSPHILERSAEDILDLGLSSPGVGPAPGSNAAPDLGRQTKESSPIPPSLGIHQEVSSSVDTEDKKSEKAHSSHYRKLLGLSSPQETPFGIDFAPPNDPKIDDMKAESLSSSTKQGPISNANLIANTAGNGAQQQGSVSAAGVGRDESIQNGAEQSQRRYSPQRTEMAREHPIQHQRKTRMPSPPSMIEALGIRGKLHQDSEEETNSTLRSSKPRPEIVSDDSDQAEYIPIRRTNREQGVPSRKPSSVNPENKAPTGRVQKPFVAEERAATAERKAKFDYFRQRSPTRPVRRQQSGDSLRKSYLDRLNEEYSPVRRQEDEDSTRSTAPSQWIPKRPPPPPPRRHKEESNDSRRPKAVRFRGASPSPRLRSVSTSSSDISEPRRSPSRDPLYSDSGATSREIYKPFKFSDEYETFYEFLRQERDNNSDPMFLDAFGVTVVEVAFPMTLEQMFHGLYIRQRLTWNWTDSKSQQRRQERQSVPLDILPGVRPGTRFPVLKLRSQKEEQDSTDLHVVITQREDDYSGFKLEGDDLSTELHLDLKTALLGWSGWIKGISRFVWYERLDPIGDKEIIVIPGEGMPISGSSARGDLKVMVRVNFPHRLSTWRKNILSEVLSKQQRSSTKYRIV